MARQKNKKPKASKKNRLITRILGATLMLFIMLVLLFIAIKFLSGDENSSAVPTKQDRIDNAPVSNESTDQNSSHNENQGAKYSFYDELKQRSSEVEAEINAKIRDSERQQQTVAGDNYRIQVGAFRNKDKADRLRARIILRDYPVMILRSNSMYLVQVGPYKAREDAIIIQKRLEREGMNTLLKNYVAQ